MENMKKLKGKMGAILAVVSFAAPAIALGAGAQPLQMEAPLSTWDDFYKFFTCDLLNWLFTLAILWSVFQILLAAYKYMSSKGAEKETKEARQALIYAAVGIAVAVLAWGLPDVISTFLGGSGFGSLC